MEVIDRNRRVLPGSNLKPILLNKNTHLNRCLLDESPGTVLNEAVAKPNRCLFHYSISYSKAVYLIIVIGPTDSHVF